MDQQPEPDRHLLERVAQRDKAAFEQVYLKYHNQVYQYLLRMFRQPHLVEEIVNDVMLVVWNKAGTFRGQSKVSTWIIGIAYRRGLKSAKRAQQQQHREQAEDAIPEGSLEAVADQAQVTPANLLEQAEFQAHIKRGLAALSMEHRSVVELTILGYAYAEIALIVDCPVNTVKTRMFNARRQLRHHLRGSNDLENTQ